MDAQNDLVSVKVNRVISRDVKLDHFMGPDEFENLVALEDNFDTDCIGENFRQKWRRLPRRLSQAYLGETFWFSLMIVNDSVREPMKDMLVKVVVQTSGGRVVEIGTIKSPYLDAKQSLNDILRYEFKDPGVQVMICTISYKNPSQEDHSFRKFFKFQVDKPLDVKTKFYNAENDEVFLEAMVQNLTTVPICLEKVALEPSQFFDVKEMNKITVEKNEEWVFGEVNRFNPRESRQYLFCLTPKSELRTNVKLLKEVTAIGKLDIVWLTGIGVNGRIQTSSLERMIPGYTGIRLTVEGIPSKAKLKEQFCITLRLTNYCDYMVEPAVYFHNKDEEQSILWLGVSGQSFPKIKPFEFHDFNLTAYPIRTGLQPIPKITVTDLFSKNTYKFVEISFIYIQDQED